MIELHPSALSDEMEQMWVETTMVEPFLERADSGNPINLLGRSTFLQERLAQRRPDLYLRSICPVAPGETLPVPPSGADIHYVSVAGISEAILPRSRTLILNPFLAQYLLLEPEFLKTLSLKTFEWVIVPLFVVPEPFFTLYSEQFSFQEPLGDDDANRCWTEHPGAAVVSIINGGEAGEYFVDFTLIGAQPGTFEVSFGSTRLSRKVEQGDLTYRFRLRCGLLRGMNELRISFTGPPWTSADPREQSEKLYFCFANLRLQPCRNRGGSYSFSQSGLTPLRDPSIRRAVHNRGFFEIQTIGTSTPALEYAVGLRSCFDYMEGFRLRDYRRFSSTTEMAKDSSLSNYPILWYCLRKTPTPGSEWESHSPLLAKHETLFVERTSEDLAGEDLDLQTAELVETRRLLVERTVELVETRRLLAERTAALERIAKS